MTFPDDRSITGLISGRLTRRRWLLVEVGAIASACAPAPAPSPTAAPPKPTEAPKPAVASPAASLAPSAAMLKDSKTVRRLNRPGSPPRDIFVLLTSPTTPQLHQFADDTSPTGRICWATL